MDPVLVWSRAFALAAVTMLAGVVGHVSADGLLPGVPVLIGMFGGAVVLCAAMLNRPASRSRIVAMLVTGQTVVHVALAATAGHADDHHAVATTPYPGAGGLLSIDEHIVSDLSAHAPMMAVHLAAAALVGLWLAAGEHALWALVALASRAALGPLMAAAVASRVVVVRTAPEVLPVITGPRPPRALALLARVVVRRGPPAFLAA